MAAALASGTPSWSVSEWRETHDRCQDLERLLRHRQDSAEQRRAKGEEKQKKREARAAKASKVPAEAVGPGPEAGEGAPEGHPAEQTPAAIPRPVVAIDPALVREALAVASSSAAPESAVLAQPYVGQPDLRFRGPEPKPKPRAKRSKPKAKPKAAPEPPPAAVVPQVPDLSTQVEALIAQGIIAPPRGLPPLPPPPTAAPTQLAQGEPLPPPPARASSPSGESIYGHLRPAVVDSPPRDSSEEGSVTSSMVRNLARREDLERIIREDEERTAAAAAAAAAAAVPPSGKGGKRPRAPSPPQLVSPRDTRQVEREQLRQRQEEEDELQRLRQRELDRQRRQELEDLRRRDRQYDERRRQHRDSREQGRQQASSSSRGPATSAGWDTYRSAGTGGRSSPRSRPDTTRPTGEDRRSGLPPPQTIRRRSSCFILGGCKRTLQFPPF